jgi:hypothetical protein
VVSGHIEDARFFFNTVVLITLGASALVALVELKARAHLPSRCKLKKKRLFVSRKATRKIYEILLTFKLEHLLTKRPDP